MCFRRFALVLALAAGGCSDGPPMGDVAGSVMMDSKAPETGAISFFAVDGKAPTAGGQIKEGKYTARVPVGLCRVEIRIPKVVGKKQAYGPDSGYRPILDEALPDRYNNKSTLTFDVKSGLNQKDWDLSTK